MFMSQLQYTNQTLPFFCDFKKIGQNVDDIKLSLCVLNSLIGTQDLKKSVETIWKRDKSAFQVLPILIAVRDKKTKGKKGKVKMVKMPSGECVPLKSLLKSPEGIVSFLENTGLAEIFEKKMISDLTD